MVKILAINGSYRKDGITDQTLAAMARAAQAAGAEVEIIHLREQPIEFCTNCRSCTQLPGAAPGTCVIDDGMQRLIEQIELADAYILAAPTNFYSATAVFKRFMERLVVYAYWPWAMNSPQFRKANATQKKAVVLTSSAAPGVMGRWLFGTHKQLKMTAKTIGAETVGSLSTGLIAKQPLPQLPPRVRREAEQLAARLL